MDEYTILRFDLFSTFQTINWRLLVCLLMWFLFFKFASQSSQSNCSIGILCCPKCSCIMLCSLEIFWHVCDLSQLLFVLLAVVWNNMFVHILFPVCPELAFLTLKTVGFLLILIFVSQFAQSNWSIGLWCFPICPYRLFCCSDIFWHLSQLNRLLTMVWNSMLVYILFYVCLEITCITCETISFLSVLCRDHWNIFFIMYYLFELFMFSILNVLRPHLSQWMFSWTYYTWFFIFLLMLASYLH